MLVELSANGARIMEEENSDDPPRADNATNTALLLKKLDLDHNMLYHI